MRKEGARERKRDGEKKRRVRFDDDFRYARGKLLTCMIREYRTKIVFRVSGVARASDNPKFPFVSWRHFRDTSLVRHGASLRDTAVWRCVVGVKVKKEKFAG